MSPLAFALALLATAPAWKDLPPKERDAAVATLAQEPLATRFLTVSERFLGTPYGTSPLGEGPGHPPDPDPLIRYDQVDCLTFVETAMALSLSAPAPGGVEAVLTRIRYKDQPVYEQRNHLMEADWIPNNLAKGFVTDVTRALGGASAALASKTFTAESWTSESAKGLGLPPDHQAKGTFSLWMLPTDELRRLAAKIPSGTIAVEVKEDRPMTITRVSHLGIIVQKKDGPVMRHATSIKPLEVVDEPLPAFLSRHGTSKWKTVGYSLYALSAPAKP